jgi:hypothetical protein
VGMFVFSPREGRLAQIHVRVGPEGYEILGGVTVLGSTEGPPASGLHQGAATDRSISGLRHLWKNGGSCRTTAFRNASTGDCVVATGGNGIPHREGVPNSSIPKWALALMEATLVAGSKPIGMWRSTVRGPRL